MMRMMIIIMNIMIIIRNMMIIIVSMMMITLLKTGRKAVQVPRPCLPSFRFCNW